VRVSKKNTVIIAVLIIIAAAAAYGYKEYYRKPADVTSIAPTAKVSAAEIAGIYDSDEARANKLYLGKTIQVTGAIAEIINQQDTLVNVLIGDSNSLHKVSCLLAHEYNNEIKQYTIGKPITIKGICTGFLIDVELNRCVIVAVSQP
jgi:hypothetical protein